MKSFNLYIKAIIILAIGVGNYWSANAQDDMPSRNRLQQNNALGYSYKTGEFRTGLYIPADTLSTLDSGAIAYIGARFYIKDQYRWHEHKQVAQLNDSVFTIGIDTIKIRGVGGGKTDLDTLRNEYEVEILNSTGTSAIIPAADSTNAGVMKVSDFIKLSRFVWDPDSNRYFINNGSELKSLAYKTDARLYNLQNVLNEGNTLTGNNDVFFGSGNFDFSSDASKTQYVRFTQSVPNATILQYAPALSRIEVRQGGGSYATMFANNNIAGYSLSTPLSTWFTQANNNLNGYPALSIGKNNNWLHFKEGQNAELDLANYKYLKYIKDPTYDSLVVDSLAIPNVDFVKKMLNDSITVQSIFNHPLNGIYRYDSNLIIIPVNRNGKQFVPPYPTPSFDRGFMNAFSNVELEPSDPYGMTYWLTRGGNMMWQGWRIFDESRNDTAFQNWNPIMNLSQFYRFKNDGTSLFERGGSYPRWNPQQSGYGSTIRVQPPKNMNIGIDPNGTNLTSYHGSLDFGRDSSYNLHIETNLNYRIPITVYSSQIDFDRSGTNRERIITSNGHGMAGYTAYWKSRQGGNINNRGSYISKVTDFYSAGSMLQNPYSGLIKDTILLRSQVDTAISFYAAPKWRATNEVKNGIGFWASGVNDFNALAGKVTLGKDLDLTQLERIVLAGKTKIEDSLILLTVPAQTYVAQSILGIDDNGLVIALDANDFPGGGGGGGGTDSTDHSTIGSSGSAPNWSLDGDKYTLNIPAAGPAVSMGAVTSGNQQFAGMKRFNAGAGFGIDPASGVRLTLGAGSATITPLLFNSGALRTAVQNGGWEFDGSHLYFGIGGNRYQIDNQFNYNAPAKSILGNLTSSTDSVLYYSIEDLAAELPAQNLYYDATLHAINDSTIGVANTPVVSITTNTTIPDDDVRSIRLVNATSAAVTITLPAAIDYAGREQTVKKIDSSGNTVTVAAAGSDTIDGATTVVLSTQYKYIKVISDGSNWYIVGGN